METFQWISLFLVFFLVANASSNQLLKGLKALFASEIDPSLIVTEELLPIDLPPRNAFYDFIIIGGGTAGCVLANRLSENSNWTVFLLEAGGKETFAHGAPILASYLPLTDSNWGYKSVPQKNACFGMHNNECSLPRGKMLSGSSGINFMMYVRGNPRDFDRWAEAGNPGWSYKEVLPYFKRSEMSKLNGMEDSPYHNTNGYLSVEHIKHRTDILTAFVNGSQEAGHKLIDYNGKSQFGVSYVQATTKNGHRHSAFNAFIEPIRNKRKNLHILSFATVTKILIDPETNSAYGVEFLHNNIKHTIRAKKEVILSAGVFNSPQLLMLSGIGPKDVLSSIGVPVIKELPVGKLLYDHISFFGPIFTINTTDQTLFAKRLGAMDVLKFVLDDSSTKFGSIGCVESLVFFKTPNSKEPSDLPDIELILVASSIAGDYGKASKRGYNIRDDIYDKVLRPLHEPKHVEHLSFIVMLLHPKSFGYVTLKDDDPLTPPIIDPNYFAYDEDVEFILEGIKEAIRLTKTPQMQAINATLHAIPTPGCESYEFGSDDYWRCSIRVFSSSLHHQLGTCKMGSYKDATSVVNSQLKVHDIRKLRVVDASVIPLPVTGHTAAPVYMIGEKASNMIKEEWLGRNK